MLKEVREGMNANEKRTFNQFKQKIYSATRELIYSATRELIYSATREFYTKSGLRLTLQDQLLIDYFAGTYAAELMEELKEANTQDD